MFGLLEYVDAQLVGPVGPVVPQVVKSAAVVNGPSTLLNADVLPLPAVIVTFRATYLRSANKFGTNVEEVAPLMAVQFDVLFPEQANHW